MKLRNNRWQLENRNTISNDQPKRSLQTIERFLDINLTILMYG